MTFIVATIDLDSSSSPSYDELDNVMAEHGLFASQPRELSAIPRNTYLGRTPEEEELQSFAHRVFDAVREAHLTPTRLFIACTTDENAAVVTADD